MKDKKTIKKEQLRLRKFQLFGGSVMERAE